MTELPKMAIDIVDFHLGKTKSKDSDKEYVNKSVLYDEIIAHRLAMLPIPTNIDLWRDKKDYGILYSLTKCGPGTIYSKDLIPLGIGILDKDSKLDKVEYEEGLEIIDKNIPITVLSDEQALCLYAIARFGTGKEHAKWQSAQAIAYKNYPVIKINRNTCNKCGKCVEICKHDVFVNKNGINIEKPENCIYCKECIKNCIKNAITVEMEKDKFIFSYETDGSLAPETVFLETLKILNDKVSKYTEELNKLLFS